MFRDWGGRVGAGFGIWGLWGLRLGDVVCAYEEHGDVYTIWRHRHLSIDPSIHPWIYPPIHPSTYLPNPTYLSNLI